MKLSDFDYPVPNELIAQYPLEKRDESRLMVIHRKTKEIEHKTFRDILGYFEDGDLLVLNDTKVFPARLFGSKEKTGALIDVFLLRELNKDSKLWDVVVDPARKIRVGNKLYFGDGNLVAEVVDNTTARGRTIRFLFDGNEEQFLNKINLLGHTPLPRYITRDPEPSDLTAYQTVYAESKGSVTAPYAGFHFTKELLKRLELQGVEQVYITLQTGMSIFRDVEVEDLSKHKMDSEHFRIPEATVEMVNKAKQKRKKICAVGSTVMRTLESSVSASKTLKPNANWTDKFIFPPYDFNIANVFLTNFQPPRSTMAMMVAAFLGYDFFLKVYKEAVNEKYRFYCYGDAMLIL